MHVSQVISEILQVKVKKTAKNEFCAYLFCDDIFIFIDIVISRRFSVM